MTAPGTVTADPLAVLEEIRRREQAATPGPWRWYGNSDVHSIYLATRRWGRQFVMQFRRWGMQGAEPVFCTGRTWKPDSDGGLDFRRQPGGGMTAAHHMPVFEVEPRATERGDERVYRADLIGIRNPDAMFIAAARTDVGRLLAVAEAVTALCRDTDGNWLEPSSSLPVGEFQAALSRLAEEVPAP